MLEQLSVGGCGERSRRRHKKKTSVSRRQMARFPERGGTHHTGKERVFIGNICRESEALSVNRTIFHSRTLKSGENAPV